MTHQRNSSAQDAVQGDAPDRISRRYDALLRFVSAYEKWTSAPEWEIDSSTGAVLSAGDAEELHASYLQAKEALK